MTTPGRDTATSRLTSEAFVARWNGRDLSERAAAQSHFNDLCRLLNVPAPTDQRETDSSYGFEARASVSASNVYERRTDEGASLYVVETGPGRGFVDVWLKDHFCWEYKRPDKHPTLASALAQARAYAAALGNPPLIVVCDINRYQIHTNFTNHPSETYAFSIDELLAPSQAWKTKHPGVSPLECLRNLFDDPEAFRPKRRIDAITEELATEIGNLALALRDNPKNDPHAVAHFIMQIVFCLFAEDIGLLPKDVFATLVEKSMQDPASLPAKAKTLFKAMEKGGHFGADTIEWFNGGLYKDVDRDPDIAIAVGWIGKLRLVAKADWSAVEPSILGTLFERSLDPEKRSQIGAHYTGRDDIMLIVEPVVMEPLRREWVDVQKDCAKWVEQRTRRKTEKSKRTINDKIEQRLLDFVDRLGSVRILDPACGSGNFLYVAIQQLLDLESRVRAFAASPEIGVAFTPRVHPRQLHGIEINPYAAELARVSIWIGYLKWLHANGSVPNRRPILDPLDTIENRDAILAWADRQDEPLPTYEPGATCLGPARWPQVDFIIGNPPFLGTKLLRRAFGDAYVEFLFDTYRDRIPGFSDLCCYWFELAREAIVGAGSVRCGLLATQGIRGGENRTVLRRIKQTGDIFLAISDRNWVLDGANVHVSIVGFDAGVEDEKRLDNQAVHDIHSDLTAGVDITQAVRLPLNADIGFVADVKAGAFDVPWQRAREWLAQPNPHRRSNLDVLRPWCNGSDITRRMRGVWIIDFGYDRPLEDASRYEAPFAYLERHVRPSRSKVKRRRYRELWWLHAEPCEAMRRATATSERTLVTPTLTKHRLFAWIDRSLLPDHQLIAFARDDDYFFGVLQSSLHEVWARRAGTQLREATSGFRYTPTTCFETFPLPWPPGAEPEDDPLHRAIADAAAELNRLRENWLNPPEWIAAVADAVDRFEDFSDVPDEKARELLRASAIQARAANDARLKKRTLTNLYNQRPSWLKLAHRKLDEAVLNAYAHVDPAPGPAPRTAPGTRSAPEHPWDPAWAAAWEPFGAGEITPVTSGRNPDPPDVIEAKQAAIERRAEVDEMVLANLLRLNQERK